MALSAFDDKEKPPGTQELKQVLESAGELWDQLIQYVARQYPPVTEDWGFSGKNWGWGLRLKQKKRTILYMTPSTGFFYVGFALGEKAANAALASDLPATIKHVIETAPRYAEGRGVRLEVRSADALPAIFSLTGCKMG